MGETVTLARVEAFAYRSPIAEPVATSFGVMRDRPAVFVRVEDSDGAFGWGEIFANWPAAAAEHRANLLARDIADLALGAPLEHPSDLYRQLSERTRIPMIQSGEWGPFRQVIAGLDVAVWDLFARKAGLPLRRFLDPRAPDRVPAYASGIGLGSAPEAIARARDAGFAAFKVKVGADPQSDAAKVVELVSSLRPGEHLFTDANQGWDRPGAERFIAALGGAEIGWLEEPLTVDAPEADWRALAGHAIPLAGGENIAGRDAFDHAVSAGILSVIQPDIAKWGGITDCFAVARAAIAAGRRYCPHFLGGGIGLLASAHLLAAAGGDGRLEVDVNPNPLREEIAPAAAHMTDDGWTLEEGHGLGVAELPASLMPYATLRVARDRAGG